MPTGLGPTHGHPQGPEAAAHGALAPDHLLPSSQSPSSLHLYVPWPVHVRGLPAVAKPASVAQGGPARPQGAGPAGLGSVCAETPGGCPERRSAGLAETQQEQAAAGHAQMLPPPRRSPLTLL